MTTSGDIDTMAALADTEVDKLLGGHTDDHLASLLSSSSHLHKINSNSVPMKQIFGLIGELINKVYDLENP